MPHMMGNPPPGMIGMPHMMGNPPPGMLPNHHGMVGHPHRINGNDDNDDNDDDMDNVDDNENDDMDGNENGDMDGNEGGNEDKGIRVFLNTVMVILRAICADDDLYLESWYSMHMFKEQTCLALMDYAKETLISRVDKAKNKTPEGEAEMELWGSFFRVCIVLLAQYTSYDWKEFPDPELYKKSWPDTPSHIIPIIQKECFPKIPRKTYLVSILPSLLRLLSLCEQVSTIEAFVADIYFGIAVDEFKQTGKFERTTSVSCETVDAVMTDKRNGKADCVIVPDKTLQRFFNAYHGTV